MRHYRRHSSQHGSITFLRLKRKRISVMCSSALALIHCLFQCRCCWVLMALLFVGGVMNVLWIAAISAFVLIEKIVPVGRLISRIAGAGFVAAGTWLVVAL